jgi:hypothetical protein
MEIADSALSLVRSVSGGEGSAPSASGGSAPAPSASMPAASAGVSAGELPMGANSIVQNNIDLLLGGLTYTSSGGASGGGSSSGNLVNATA